MKQAGSRFVLWVVLVSALVGLAAAGCSDDDDDGTGDGAADASVGGTGGGGAGTGGDGAGELPECEGGEPDPQTCLACVRQGLLQGKIEGETCEYLGIPYAKPPVGELRWTAPEPADGWSGIREATAYGATCVQGGFGGLLAGEGEKSEDCLFLNVWTPVAPPAEALPVMVFVHGGGYTSGTTSTYPAYGLSEKGPVVVASMNYRLAALAFFAHPDLDAERPDAPSGSDGIRDQQLAMQWVQDNIAAFGGDPGNVTLFGESAGSSSVCIHMVSPLSSGLARRFIMESGTCLSRVSSGIAPTTSQDMYALTELMADELCPDAADPLACLRALPAEDIMTWTPPVSGDGSEMTLDWRPVVEGAGGVLPEHPNALIESGNYNQGEVIIGSNLNEYGLFELMRGGARTMEELRSRVESAFGERAEEVLAVYAPDDSIDPRQTYIDLQTDISFRCGSRALARMVSEDGNPVYLYSFEQGLAVHAAELPFVFYPALVVPEDEVALADAMQEYWTRFAVDGDPNSGGLVEWPVYDVTGDRHLILADPISTGSAWREAECDFWDSYLASL